MYQLTIADHHPIIKEGLQHILSDHDFIISNVVVDGKDLDASLEKSIPDLLILELDLPNLQGLSSIKALRKKFAGIKILIFSQHPEEMYALSSIKAGAMGYVGKLAPIKTVRSAIMQVNKGGIYLNKELSSMLAKNENTSNNIAYRYKRLSSRETEVLNMLSSGKRNKDIAQMLDINEKTVSTYKTRLLRKLDASSLAELIQQARLLQTSDL